MLSDLNRSKKKEIPHAVPIAYGLSGYSLKTENIRKMLHVLVRNCEKYDMRVDVLSSDGQFCKLAVREGNGSPLTILQLQKDAWEEAKKVSKVNQVKSLMNMNCSRSGKSQHEFPASFSVSYSKNQNGQYTGPIVIDSLKDQEYQRLYTPQNIEKLIKSSNKKVIVDGDVSEKCDDSDNLDILHYLPSDVLQMLDDEAYSKLKDITKHLNKADCNSNKSDSVVQTAPFLPQQLTTSANFNDESVSDNTNNYPDSGEVTIDYDGMLDVLKVFQTESKKNKWDETTVSKLKDYLSNVNSTISRFTKAELLLVIGASGQHDKFKSQFGKSLQNASKSQLVNLVSKIWGNEQVVSKTRKSVPKLQTMIRKKLSSWPKTAINAIVATHIFLKKLATWRKRSKCFAECAEIHLSNLNTEIYHWYSFPEFIDDLQRSLFFILDAHHLFVNSRSLVCGKGIPQRGINKKAWSDVAKSHNTDLSVAMVEDLIDKQSNEIAKITYSLSVQYEMERLGYHKEAKFCQIMTRWYEAEDEPSISVDERFYRRLELRNFLLDGVVFANFPPYGSHINGIPYVMFEGLMTNIDRRIQLYAVVKNGTYNVRAPTSLDSENFFGEFQNLDPKGSGVLLPDDIPKAMETAAYILNSRVNPNRYGSVVNYNYWGQPS